ncbi:Capsular glucan synthase [Crateriforma conspicua]|uniref:Capsular glucan synthase n=1 Tax=Crateriforma conspicua TaxID=2527996 RepID=A0A5C5Y0Y1_9PLAN|nr:glycosyltransferase [Crateriforma conspicua]TWT69416.1 Capsular glucan synthase [Crateriforma conspicua]
MNAIHSENRRIRVALIIPTMDRGGAEKQLCLLASGLDRDAFDVHVFLLTRGGPRLADLQDAGIPVTLIGKRFKADPTALWRLKKALQAFRPDVAHTWIFAANSFGRAAAILAGVPSIVASERCVDPWKGWRHLAIDRALAKRSDAITTNSQGVVDFYAGHAIDANKFVVIPNGIPPRHVDDISRDEALDRLGIDPSRRLILAVGRLWPQKRYRDLIWAAELVATVREDTTLVIIGDGPQRGELLRHRDTVTRPDRVWFAGQHDDVAQLLPHADVFWIASEYEGQSNAVIEAMQAGVPVVASNIPGNVDLVVHGETGWLVKLGDTADFARQTLALLDDSQEAERLGAAGRQRIEQEFTVESMVRRHADLYRRLCVGKAGSTDPA